MAFPGKCIYYKLHLPQEVPQPSLSLFQHYPDTGPGRDFGRRRRRGCPMKGKQGG